LRTVVGLPSTQVAEPDEWARLAELGRQEGNWWPHWSGWVQARSGELIVAPGKPGSRNKPLGAAPGECDHVK